MYPWNKGKKIDKKKYPKIGHTTKHTEESKKKMRLSKLMAGIKPPSRLGKIPWNKGNKLYIREYKKNDPKWKVWNKGKSLYHLRGKNHPNWKGGLTSVYYKVKNSFQYRQWRSDVFTRDNFTCQECGERKSGSIEVHHIKAFSRILSENNIKKIEEAENCEELWNINNGLTLCIDCHKKTNNYGGKATKIL